MTQISIEEGSTAGAAALKVSPMPATGVACWQKGESLGGGMTIDRTSENMLVEKKVQETEKEGISTIYNEPRHLETKMLGELVPVPG